MVLQRPLQLKNGWTLLRPRVRWPSHRTLPASTRATKTRETVRMDPLEILTWTRHPDPRLAKDEIRCKSIKSTLTMIPSSGANALARGSRKAVWLLSFRPRETMLQSAPTTLRKRSELSGYMFGYIWPFLFLSHTLQGCYSNA